jgi:ribosomal protein L7/L12
MALTFGLGRLILDDAEGRSAGIYGVAIGLVGLMAGLADRRMARSAERKRAALGAGSSAVLLADAGPRRKDVVVVLRSALGLALAEAKQSVDHPDSVPVSGIDRAAAESVVERLRAAGATAEVVDSPRAAEQQVQ